MVATKDIKKGIHSLTTMAIMTSILAVACLVDQLLAQGSADSLMMQVAATTKNNTTMRGA